MSINFMGFLFFVADIYWHIHDIEILCTCSLTKAIHGHGGEWSSQLLAAAWGGNWAQRPGTAEMSACFAAASLPRHQRLRRPLCCLAGLAQGKLKPAESRMSCATLLKLHGTHTMTYDDMVSEGLLIDWGILDILCYPSISIHCSKEKHRTRKSNGWTADWLDLNILNYFKFQSIL